MSKALLQRYLAFTYYLETYGFSILLLFIRLWIAKIFWLSGLNKISDWPSTLYLFEYQYKVPIIPPEIAAYIAAFFELSCPILLTVGFLSRIAAIPLICMTLVIQFTYLSMPEHVYWLILLSVIVLKGPGYISIDYWLRNKITSS